MSDKHVSEDQLRSARSRATAEPLTEWEQPELVDADEYEELAEDVALAQQAVEEYEAKGIEGTIPYGRYRSKRLGPESCISRYC